MVILFKWDNHGLNGCLIGVAFVAIPTRKAISAVAVVLVLLIRKLVQAQIKALEHSLVLDFVNQIQS